VADKHVIPLVVDKKNMINNMINITIY